MEQTETSTANTAQQGGLPHPEQGAKSKTARKRAKRACLSCRTRKVRCDVSHGGTPCMNCYLDGEECVVLQRASRSM